MSQRLSSTRKHPITGEEIAPLWFDQNGIAFYPPMGAAPDDDGEDGGDGSDDGDGEGGDEGSEGQDKSGDSGKDSEDVEALRKRMIAADKRAAAAEKKAKELEDKDKDEATKTAERAAALESENGELKKAVSDLSLQVAFLSSNDIAWHDPEVALQNADLSEVLQEDGTLDKKALKKALEDLSKKKPFLVKAKDDSSDDDEPLGSTGNGSVGKGKKKEKVALDKDRLRAKYPALYT